MRDDPEALERAIGHRFVNRGVLERALRHSSHAHEKAPDDNAAKLRDNEQLEFLGDSILGFLISESLVQRFPDYSEGRLSKLKAHLVSTAYLHEVALRLEIGKYLELGHGEEMSGGRAKRTLLADAIEALIAALYLDAGMDAAREFVTVHIAGAADGTAAMLEERIPRTLVDFRSALQELAQARKLPPPHYTTIREQGPGHSKTFTIEVRVGRDLAGQAEGLTKKSAAQKAAREVYERLLAQP